MLYLHNTRAMDRVLSVTTIVRREFMPVRLFLLPALMVAGALPCRAVQTLTFNGVSTVLSTGTETLDAPVGIAVDSSFNVYISDTNGSAGRITKIAQNGTSSVLDITGLTLSTAPKQIAIDGAGNLYIADSGNSRIVKVNPSTGAASVLSAGSITLSGPQGVAMDAAGDTFIADTGNSRIVEVPASGTPVVYTINVSSGSASLSVPEGVAIDVSGNLYIADSGNGRIVEVPLGGSLPATGTPLSITAASSNGAVPTAPVGVAVDSFGTLYVADASNNRIVSVSASTGTNFSSVHTLTNNDPAGVAVDLYGNVYVADTGTPAIDMVQINAIGFGHNQLGITTFKDFQLVIGQTAGPDLTNLTIPAYGKVSLDFTAGGGTSCTAGTANQSTCIIDVQYKPIDPGYRQGAMILTYVDNSDTPQVTRSLTVPLYAFNDTPQAALYPGITSVLSSGSVATTTPYQIAVDGSGNVYVGNKTSNNVVEIPAGAGSASVLSTGSFTLGSVAGVAIDGAGDRFIADNQNNLIYEVNAANSPYQVSIDVGGSPITPSGPTALAVDGGGDLFIADSGNNRILKVALKDPTLTTTFPMTAIVVNAGGYTFNGITGLAVDAMQNLYVVDSSNSKLVKITPAGVSSIVSFPGFTLTNPEGVALDGMGNIYVTDTGNSRVLQLTKAGAASQIQLQGLTTPLGGGSGHHLYGVTVDYSGNIYVADSTNNRVVKVNVSEASLSFASTKQGETSTDSPQTATVLNLGDQALTFSANPTYPASFVENSADTNPCTSATSLSAGTSCDIPVNFIPQTLGSLSQNITIPDNSLNATNGSTQLVVAKGTGLIAADTTAVAISVSPSPVIDGQGATITATVTDTTTGDTSQVPTGSVTFSDLVGSTSTSLNSGSPVTLSGGVGTLAGVVLKGVGTHTITAVYAGVSGSYATSSHTTTVVVGKASVALTGPATVPVTVADGQTGAVPVTVTGPYTSLSAPTGTLSYSVLNSTNGVASSGTASLTAGSGSSSATIPVPNTLAPGSYTVNVTYSGDSNYASTASDSSEALSIALTVSGLTARISLVSSLNPAQPGNAVTFTATVSASSGTPTGSVRFYDGPALLATVALNGSTAAYTTSSLTAGTHSMSAVYSGDSNFQSVTSASVQESVGKLAAIIALTSSLNPALLSSAVTFAATVSASGGTPTGSVGFYDGSTLLSSVALTGLQAAYTTSALAAGTHSMSAVYSGDSSFQTATSAAVSELVQDFTISTPTSGTGNAPTQTVVPGGTATYMLSVGPSVGTVFPAPVTLSLSGLPPGATGTLSPTSMPAGSSLTSVTLTIQLPQTSAANQSPARNLPLAATLSLALLWMPLAGRVRRGTKGWPLACLLFVAACAVAGLSGCGAKNTGYFGQQAQTYNISIIATSGSIQHSTSVTLTVE